MSSELLDRFLEEARDLLDQASRGLLELERTDDQKELVNTVFRAFHTMKGSSALFDLRPMTRTLHASEDLLHAVREGGARLEPGMVDMLLAALDQVTAWLRTLETGVALGPDDDETADALVERARAVGGEHVGVEVKASAPTFATHSGVVPAWLGFAGRTPEFVGQALVGIEYDPDPGCFFTGDDPLRLFALLPSLLYLKVIGGDRLGPESDPFQCLLQFRAVAACSLADAQELFKYVPEQVKLYEFDIGFGSEIDGCVRALREVVRALGETPNQGVAAARRRAHALFVGRAMRASGFPPSWIQAFDETAERALRAGDDLFLRAAVERVLGSVQAAGRAGIRLSMAPSATRMSQIALSPFVPSKRPPPLRPSTPPGASGAALVIAREPAAAVVTANPPPRADAPRKEERALPQVYKVDQARIDVLLDLAGELLVTKNALPYLSRRAESMSVPVLAREIKDQASTLTRIAESFHHAVMQLRIIPLSHVFERFPRLVRDLSRQLGKHVRLVVSGENTEADKSTVEKLADPLIHIVRNSLDHGLETPADRAETGKSPEGTLRLSARQERGALIVEIEDDGRGIDPQKIREAAVRKGVLGRDDAARLTDEEATNLIFRAGFSTKEQVSDLSGRGVGMDVVRTAIDACKGTVRVTSQVGRGTKVVLKLPLSMAVTRVLLIESAKQIFGLPFESVLETVHVAHRDVTSIRGVPAVAIRERVAPLFHLSELLSLPDPQSEDREEPLTVLLVRLPSGDVGLSVDSLHEVVDVMLKPLEGPLSGVRGYLGTSMLGDGRALLVLNLSDLFEEKEIVHADSVH